MDKIQSVEDKDLPRMPIGRTVAAFAALKPVFVTLAGKEITPKMYKALRTKVIEVLPKSVPKEKIDGALSPLLMETRTALEMDWYVRRLAGNITELAMGQVIGMTPGVGPDGWNVGQIVEAETIVTKRSGWRKKLWFRVLVGPWAGDEVSMITTPKAMFYIGSQAGFSRHSEHLKQFHANEITGFILTIYVKNSNNPNWGPSVAAYGTYSGQFTKNRKLAHERRKDICPHGIIPMDCNECVRGLDTCKFAVRQYTWVRRKCDKCKEEHWHNPRDMTVCCKCDNARLHLLFKDYQHD